MASDDLSIYVYKGEWGLPSIDLDCLKALMFIKLTGAPVEIKISNGVIWSPNGILPYLQHKGRKIAGFQKIIHYLNNLGYTLKDEAAATSMEVDEGFVRLNLYPYFQYLLWCPENIDKTRAIYAHRIQFPLNFYTPKKYLQRAENTIQQICGFSFDDPIAKHDIAEIAAKAKQCLNLLEERITPEGWLGDNTPGMVDCTIYAFCSILINHKMPNNSLQVHLQQCPKLTKYVQRITKKYFEKEAFSSMKKEENTPKSSSKEYYTAEQEKEQREVRKRYIVSAFVATISMAVFAILKEIKISARYDDEEVPQFEFEGDYVDEGEEGGE
ncbi:metaxin-1 homolog [Culicoides brevitarsis]|uniref:metaxin-1 homolog n=1 Tax=Culicoides brevitarsis TaxID=469753 RepID=UPI00307B78B6